MVMDDNNFDDIDKIDDLDYVLSETDGNIDVDYYEEVDISLVHINNKFLCEGFSNTDIFIKEIIILQLIQYPAMMKQFQSLMCQKTMLIKSISMINLVLRWTTGLNIQSPIIVISFGM